VSFTHPSPRRRISATGERCSWTRKVPKNTGRSGLSCENSNRNSRSVIRPEMARLTLARKIATIVLIVWKRGGCFDAQHLKPQTA